MERIQRKRIRVEKKSDKRGCPNWPLILPWKTLLWENGGIVIVQLMTTRPVWQCLAVFFVCIWNAFGSMPGCERHHPLIHVNNLKMTPLEQRQDALRSFLLLEATSGKVSPWAHNDCTKEKTFRLPEVTHGTVTHSWCYHQLCVAQFPHKCTMIMWERNHCCYFKLCVEFTECVHTKEKSKEQKRTKENKKNNDGICTNGRWVCPL